MGYFAIKTSTNSITKKQTLSINFPPKSGSGYKTEAAARGAMKRKFAGKAHFVVLQFADFAAAAVYRKEVEQLLN